MALTDGMHGWQSAIDGVCWTLGQSLGPTEGAGASGATTGQAGGNGVGGSPAGKPGGPGDMSFIILMFGLLLFMIVMTVMGGRREAKKRRELMANLRKHDVVQTTGGMLGTVAEIRENEVVLTIDESGKTRVRFTKTAISGIVRSDAGAESKPSDSAGGGSGNER